MILNSVQYGKYHRSLMNS